MPTATPTATTAHVPNLAKILALLGGPEALEEGGAFVISVEHKKVIRPEEPYKDNASLIFPDLERDNPTFKPLHITKMGDRENDYWIDAGFAYKLNGDAAYEGRYSFEVPRTGWQDGRWRCVSYAVQPPYMFGIREDADESPEMARMLNEGATGMDRENLIVNSALRIVTQAVAKS
jgi:hypothetical protein